MMRHGKRTDIVFYQNKEKYKEEEGDMRRMRMGEYRSLDVWENIGKRFITEMLPGGYRKPPSIFNQPIMVENIIQISKLLESKTYYQ